MANGRNIATAAKFTVNLRYCKDSNVNLFTPRTSNHCRTLPVPRVPRHIRPGLSHFMITNYSGLKFGSSPGLKLVIEFGDRNLDETVVRP